jgi:hypothetical protein
VSWRDRHHLMVGEGVLDVVWLVPPSPVERQLGHAGADVIEWSKDRMQIYESECAWLFVSWGRWHEGLIEWFTPDHEDARWPRGDRMTTRRVAVVLDPEPVEAARPPGAARLAGSWSRVT